MKNYGGKISSQVDIVVLAAGKGARMNLGGNKMFQRIKGVPILYRTLHRLNGISSVQNIIVVIQKHEHSEYDAMIQKYGELEKISAIVKGGEERCESVRKGLRYLLDNPDSKIVMTHDGARPFVNESLIQRLAENVQDMKITIPVRKVNETVRQLNDDKSTHMIDRDRLYLTQTPQAFCYDDIIPCFLSDDQARLKLTDEAGYYEHLGRKVTLVEGDKRNIKITTPDDLVWAELILTKHDEFKTKPFD